ncbi:hypothetical protein [Saccharothrix sp. NRRL B-16348]|uniref:hypothetical protein n=1 Tax=Saccharothrix sp. NRRL B-16348 TaxID=1415542 RepID=UPI0006AFFF98|nr:hypothetical protein [Saccharothrix sp. NRRL B-16348]
MTAAAAHPPSPEVEKTPEAIRAALLPEERDAHEPWYGEPYHRANPDGALRQLVYGYGNGLIVYLILEQQKRWLLIVRRNMTEMGEYEEVRGSG